MLIASPTVGVTAMSMVKLNHNSERNFVLDLHACILVFSSSTQNLVSLY